MSRAVAAGDTNPFGGSIENDVRRFAANHKENEPELTAPEFSIALEAVARAVAARMDHHDYGTEDKRLAFFLITDRPRILADRMKAVREPIIDNGSKNLCGSIFVTGANCTSGYSLDLNGKTTSELFEEIIAKGIGNETMVVFDPNATEKELRFYSRGVALSDVVQRFSFRTMNFTVSMLDSVMRRLCEESLVTPDAARGLGLWERADKYHPIKDTEARLQGLVRLTLSVAFDTRLFAVWWEVPGTQGRCDLFITSKDINHAGKFTAHAVLELKVLRSYSAGGSSITKKANAAAVKNGVSQAHSYRTEKAALNAILCCYDMRKPIQADGEKCFEPVRALAKRQGVALWRYRLYGSPADLRADRRAS